jgi:hypothetical protein
MAGTLRQENQKEKKKKRKEVESDAPPGSSFSWVAVARKG